MNVHANEAAQKLMADVPGLTIVRLGELANVSTQTASRWINGRTNAPPKRVALAIQALGLDPRDYGLDPVASAASQARLPDAQQALQADVRRIQRQLDTLIEYHRRGDDQHWLLAQPNP